jgi:hypothetical protein
MGLHSTFFRIDERIVSRCDDGLLLAEYALFSPRDSELPASDRVNANVSGYVTTAGVARARLEAAGVSVALAEEAASAVKPDVIDAYALGPTVRSLAARLGPYELFEGKIYDDTSQLYAGAWLDLRALATDLNVPGAGLALQALHLASALGEVDAETRVLLATESFAVPRRGGERTYNRIQFGQARSIVAALRSLRPGGRRAREDKVDDLRAELSASVRDREQSKSNEITRRRLMVLEHALAAIDVPARGPLASVELWALERQLAVNDARGVDERLNAIERTRATPATRYLREYAAFVRGVEPPRRIAERLSQWTLAGAPFYELDLLRARVWLAAGVPRYARHYARGLVEDRAAPDAVCLVALEILETTASRARTVPPPSVSAMNAANAVATAPIVNIGVPSQPRRPSRPPPLPPEYRAAPAIPPPADSATLIAPPPFDVESPTDSAPETERTIPSGMPPMTERIVEMPQTLESTVAMGPFNRGFTTDLPPRPSIVPPPQQQPRPRERYVPELVESLSLPYGTTEADLPAGAVPRTAMEVRIACTRMARDLGRDYRLWYGSRLRTDALAVEAMQRHLLSRWPDGQIQGVDAAWELRRHGALLSEIIARALQGYWVDVGPSEIGYWAMFVPPGTRTWPFGRVYRFVALGQRERDLVSYYLEMNARAKRG